MALAVHPYLQMKYYYDKHFPAEVAERYRPETYAKRIDKTTHIKFNRRGRRHKFKRFHEKH